MVAVLKSKKPNLHKLNCLYWPKWSKSDGETDGESPEAKTIWLLFTLYGPKIKIFNLELEEKLSDVYSLKPWLIITISQKKILIALFLFGPGARFAFGDCLQNFNVLPNDTVSVKRDLKLSIGDMQYYLIYEKIYFLSSEFLDFQNSSKIMNLRLNNLK